MLSKDVKMWSMVSAHAVLDLTSLSRADTQANAHMALLAMLEPCWWLKPEPSTLADTMPHTHLGLDVLLVVGSPPGVSILLQYTGLQLVGQQYARQAFHAREVGEAAPCAAALEASGHAEGVQGRLFACTRRGLGAVELWGSGRGLLNRLMLKLRGMLREYRGEGLPAHAGRETEPSQISGGVSPGLEL